MVRIEQGVNLEFMVLHGILSDSRAAGVFCGQSEMPVSSCSGEVCAARAGRRMV